MGTRSEGNSMLDIIMSESHIHVIVVSKQEGDRGVLEGYGRGMRKEEDS